MYIYIERERDKKTNLKNFLVLDIAAPRWSSLNLNMAFTGKFIYMIYIYIYIYICLPRNSPDCTILDISDFGNFIYLINYSQKLNKF